MPAPIDEKIVELVNALCDTYPTLSGRAIYRLYGQKYGRDVSSRKVQELVAWRKKGFPDEPFQSAEWRPWECADESPEERAHLLRLDAVCQIVSYRPLYRHEATWGSRLRIAVDGLSAYDQFCFTHLYSLRQMIAYYRNEKEIYTADLDGILAYKPWLPVSAHPYGMATFAHLAPKPLAGNRQDLSVEDSVRNFFVGKAWETLRVDLRPLWFIPANVEPGSFLEYGLLSASYRQDWVRYIKENTSLTDLQLGDRMARDTALQFWMGDNPIFEKPLLHGMWELTDPGDFEVPEESNTHEEAD